mmetsp:Transcript_10039/g.28125  ORF Transcript_10039/g.28125 Transcript_10039/m.28125 type:complete len:96 (+) Transcript_10039:18-305(+)
MSEEAAAAEPIPEGKEPITLRVRDQTGEETFFKIKKGTKMAKVFDAFARRKGVQSSSLRFLMDGDRVKEDDTPLSLDLEDQDMLDCMLEQTGGCL